MLDRHGIDPLDMLILIGDVEHSTSHIGFEIVDNDGFIDVKVRPRIGRTERQRRVGKKLVLIDAAFSIDQFITDATLQMSCHSLTIIGQSLHLICSQLARTCSRDRVMLHRYNAIILQYGHIKTIKYKLFQDIRVLPFDNDLVKCDAPVLEPHTTASITHKL